MINQFGNDTALLVIDAQKGINACDHWGGPDGHRNNPQSEDRIAELLAAFRGAGRPVYFTFHDSREAASPLKIAQDGGKPIAGLEPLPGEPVIVKNVNSAFGGTGLVLDLQRARISRLVVCGYFTNMCVETSVRAAGNMGYDTYLIPDACACGNRRGPGGENFSAEQVHAMSVANLHGEFCTAISSTEAIGLLSADNEGLERVQGNEA
jgi:nicotinamidase-related amidase